MYTLKVSNFGLVAPRVFPFCRNILNNIDGGYLQGNDFKADNNFLYWLVEAPPESQGTDSMNSLEEEFLKFKGKLIFFSLKDHISSSCWQHIKPSILKRVDAWLVHTTSENNPKKKLIDICSFIEHKYIVLPKYNLCPFPQSKISNKENKIFFVGYSHNHDKRILPVKILKTDPDLKDRFVGGVFSESPTEIDIFKDTLPFNNFLYELDKYQLSLCPPGQSVFCVRHVESMATGNAIISMDIDLDNEDFLYKDLIRQYLYIYSPDLSDFKHVCLYALNNERESNYRSFKLKEIFDTFLQLNEDFSYRNLTWLPIEYKLGQLGLRMW